MQAILDISVGPRRAGVVSVMLCDVRLQRLEYGLAESANRDLQCGGDQTFEATLRGDIERNC